jgi:hypothetical protein
LEYGLKKWPTSLLLLYNWGNEASSGGSVRADVKYMKQRLGKEWDNRTFRHLFETGWSSELLDGCLAACRRDNVTADAAGRIGISPLNLPELLHDVAGSG